MALYEINVYDTNFQRQAIITTWYQFSLVEALNEQDECTIIIDPTKTFEVEALKQLDALIEPVRWFPPDNTKTAITTLFSRYPEESQPIDAKDRFVAHGVGLDHLLERRDIRYRQTDTAHSTVTSQPVETAMKFFVNLNAGPGATSPPRITDGVISNLVIESDLGYGPTWTGQRGLQNLYQVIQEISKSGQILDDGTQLTVDFGIEWL